MGFFDRFLTREIKSQAGRVVFRRWRAINTRWFQVLIHAVYDHDRDHFMHDHPWNFLSFILKGGYMELYCDQNSIVSTRVASPFTFKRMQAAGEYHKILRLLNGTSWSLVVTGKRERTWGYLTNQGWMNNEKYRRLKALGVFGPEPSKRYSISPSRR